MSAFLGLLSEFPVSRRSFAAGRTLFCAGDEVRSLFLVELGVVHLVRHQEDGVPAVMQRALEGQILAEASLFSAAYHCDALAVVDAEVRCIGVDAIRRRMRGDSSFARACAEHLAHEVHRMRVRSEILSRRTVRGRLDTWLSLSPLPPKGAWTAVAEDIGVTREALYRELARRRVRAE